MEYRLVSACRRTHSMHAKARWHFLILDRVQKVTRRRVEGSRCWALHRCSMTSSVSSITPVVLEESIKTFEGTHVESDSKSHDGGHATFSPTGAGFTSGPHLRQNYEDGVKHVYAPGMRIGRYVDGDVS
ncbi:hypothetical protein PISMIDRAFT_544322 [Pisolithus microcarpus 441]|uniref:Uncharacterized protein n=1 Tax=Pisolithus microcarpus 441 TaxID=765257 RepID=A0A0C9Y9P1_9AGAM|nr:hypothetical protein PISMIDRAFT_544322 [Pisolithus microcarpus 441]